MNVGFADLDRFLDDLRSGALTGGQEVSHFILLLQEGYRRLDEGPLRLDDDLRGTDRIGTVSERPDGSSVEAVARKWGLHLIYVPSMRNGRPGDGGVSEDRGNAILSTLPLSDFQAIELPLQAQRRVAVSATVEVIGPDGLPRNVRVASVHLDHHSRWTRLFRSFGSGRAEHATLLIDAFRDEDRIVVAGDFNTWFGEDDEPAVDLMRTHFPLPTDPPEGNTLQISLLPDRLVDHIFSRLPAGWSSDYAVSDTMYGSDHRPLIGWVGPAEPLDRAPAGGVP